MQVDRKRMNARPALTAACAVGALALPAVALAGGVGAAQTPARAAQNHTVVLKNIRFNPGTISIHRGDTVTWLWRDGGTRHNVTGSSFHSRTQGGGSFAVRFTRAGTFNYHCTIHVFEGMKGKVVVH
jgi:plastocyanin